MAPSQFVGHAILDRIVHPPGNCRALEDTFLKSRMNIHEQAVISFYYFDSVKCFYKLVCSHSKCSCDRCSTNCDQLAYDDCLSNDSTYKYTRANTNFDSNTPG